MFNIFNTQFSPTCQMFYDSLIEENVLSMNINHNLLVLKTILSQQVTIVEENQIVDLIQNRKRFSKTNKQTNIFIINRIISGIQWSSHQPMIISVHWQVHALQYVRKTITTNKSTQLFSYSSWYYFILNKMNVFCTRWFHVK